jgi:hypothetical protein
MEVSISFGRNRSIRHTISRIIFNGKRIAQKNEYR